jgi:hypothetical protein
MWLGAQLGNRSHGEGVRHVASPPLGVKVECFAEI